ncbi:Bacteriophage QLRG family DNA packaging [Neorhizobium galegae bv. officinalis]|nr:Bacteriophage QLRG family DNA packaging [Neorhizobium galegae bv. officinalis]
MWHGVSVKTRPTAELVPLATLKSWLSVEHSDDDALLGQMLRGAIDRIDGPQGIGVAMMRQTWRKSMDAFRSCIHLPGAPVKGISAITYLDPDGQPQTVEAADFHLDTDSEPARLVPAAGKSWPATACMPGAVKVDYELGETDPSAVPGDLIDAVALLVAHRYQNREAAAAKTDVLPLGVEWILNEHARCHVAS